MSKRAMKKVLEQRNAASNQQVEDEEVVVENPATQKKKNYFNNKALMMPDSESEEEQQQDTTTTTKEQQPLKPENKKKKKKPKSKTKGNQEKEAEPKDDDLEFLEKQILQQSQQEEGKQQEVTIKVGNTELRGCLDIIISKLNYNKEIQKHFKNAKLTEYDGKAPKRAKMGRQHKLVYNPDIRLNLQHKFQCEPLDLNEQGLMMHVFTAAPSYESLQHEYEQVKKSLNPQQMFDFLHLHPQHCEALYGVSEYYRLKGDYKQANELLEILLYIYEESLGYSFGKVIEDPIVSRELSTNPYSQTFFMTLFKFTDILGKKGCYRSALEFSKLLLKVAPTTDPTGVLMLIDYHCLSAQQYDYLVFLAHNFGREVYKHQKYSIAYMPNMLYNCALAKFLQQRTETETLQFVEEDFTRAIDFETTVTANANVLLIRAILLYPSAIREVAKNNEYAKQHVGNADCFCGWQRKAVKELLEVDFLQRETYLYWFLGLENEDDEAGLKKTIEIFAERNKMHWKHSYIIQWVKGAIGAIQNRIEDKSFDLMAFYQGVSTLDETIPLKTLIPFQYRRYKSLVKTHFSDQSERLDFNNLLAENIGGQQMQMQNHHQFNPINPNQGLLGVIFQSLFPWVHNPMAQAGGNQQQQQQQEFEDFEDFEG